MKFNKDARQIVIDADIYNSLRVLAMFGAAGDGKRGKQLEQIDRHVVKFNQGERIKRDALLNELQQSTRNIISIERRAQRMSSQRHQQTYYVKTFSGRWVPCRVVGMDGSSPHIIHVELLTTVGDHKETWPVFANKALYAHELAAEIQNTETPAEIERYNQMMEKYRAEK